MGHIEMRLAYVHIEMCDANNANRDQKSKLRRQCYHPRH